MGKQDKDTLEYAKEFVYHDFEQCFQQMRHYDSQSWERVNCNGVCLTIWEYNRGT